MQFHFERFLVFLLTGYLLFSAPQLIDYFALPASASISQPEIVRPWREFAKIYNHEDRHQIKPEKPTILLA